MVLTAPHEMVDAAVKIEILFPFFLSSTVCHFSLRPNSCNLDRVYKKTKIHQQHQIIVLIVYGIYLGIIFIFTCIYTIFLNNVKIKTTLQFMDCLDPLKFL